MVLLMRLCVHVPAGVVALEDPASLMAIEKKKVSTNGNLSIIAHWPAPTGLLLILSYPNHLFVGTEGNILQRDPPASYL
ncbi:hypothetical protein BKA70DRAFT_1334529, partial [Coprinopsis sp. MPI-PUGE-AT-0042]